MPLINNYDVSTNAAHMLSWLEKAKGSIARQTTPEPELFAVGCDCGKTVKGERQSEAQQVRCPGCGDPVFVLPRNVYPVPKAKPKKKKKAKTKQRKEKLISIPWHVVLKNQIARLNTWVMLRLRSLGLRVISFFTPIRLIFIAIFVLISATTYWTMHSRAIEQAGTIYLQAGRDGLAAVADEEMIIAEQKLAEAVAALDLLGHADQEARTLRQRYREVVIINNLLGDSLADVIEDAQKTTRAGENWQEKFALQYQGKWIVLEAEVTAGELPGTYELDYPMLLTESQLNVQGQFVLSDTLANDNLEESGRLMMIVAMQLQECDRSSTNSSNWVVNVQSDTAQLWSGFNTYSVLGYNLEESNPFAESTRKLLQAQSDLMRVTP